MFDIKQFLTESKMTEYSRMNEEPGGAGEEAKKRGLVHISFGRYADPSNPKKVVAKSVNGKLVKVDSQNDDPSRSPDAGDQGEDGNQDQPDIQPHDDADGDSDQKGGSKPQPGKWERFVPQQKKLKAYTFKFANTKLAAQADTDFQSSAEWQSRTYSDSENPGDTATFIVNPRAKKVFAKYMKQYYPNSKFVESSDRYMSGEPY